MKEYADREIANLSSDLSLRMGLDERILRKMGFDLVILVSFFSTATFWLWILVSTGNVYLALAISVVAVSGVLSMITFRIRRKVGRWWFVEIERIHGTRPVKLPEWNVATSVFWERIDPRANPNA